MQMGTYHGKYDPQPQFFIAFGDSLKYDSPGEQIKDGSPCLVLCQAMKMFS
jgi:hypothetical protein